MTNAAPKVSVITPTYNQENYIGQCIESVLAQSLPDWEMILVDDGSTDSTQDVILSYKDPRIRYFRQENKGMLRLSETYNFAVGQSRADVIAILEGDDFWPVDKLEKQVPDFREPGVVLSHGRAILVSPEGDPQVPAPWILPSMDALLNIPKGRAAFFMCSNHWLTFTFAVTVALRKTTLEKIGGFFQTPYLPYVDLPTFMRMSLEGSFRWHDEPFGYWRRHSGSTTTNKYPTMLSGAYRFIAEFAEKYADLMPGEIGEFRNVDMGWQRYQVERLIIIGRILAEEGKFERAKGFFDRAQIFTMGKKGRQMLKAASVACQMRRSPEFAFRLGKRPPWREQHPPKYGDPIVSTDMKPEDFERFDFSQYKTCYLRGSGR